MSDVDLFVFGCAVTFIALGGVYVYVREHFLWGEPRRPIRVPSRREGPGGAAEVRVARSET